MKSMKSACMVLLCLGALCFAQSSVYAQEWSDAQKEVWNNVETYTKLWEDNDVNGLMQYFHADFLGWVNGAPMPNGKASREKWSRFSQGRIKILANELTPVGITIYGDVAVVHYYYVSVTEGKDGKASNSKGRWTDILKKQGEKWVLIADHGGDTDEDE